MNRSRSPAHLCSAQTLHVYISFSLHSRLLRQQKSFRAWTHTNASHQIFRLHGSDEEELHVAVFKKCNKKCFTESATVIFFFFGIHLKKFLVEEELLYNVVLVSAIQQRQSVTLPTPPLQVIREHQAELPVIRQQLPTSRLLSTRSGMCLPL